MRSEIDLLQRVFPNTSTHAPQPHAGIFPWKTHSRKTMVAYWEINITHEMNKGALFSVQLLCDVNQKGLKDV